MQMLISDLEGFVLAGGASRRMGRDKCQLSLDDGRTFLERTRAALSLTARTRIVGRTMPETDPFRIAAENNDDIPFVCDVYRAPDGHAPRSALTGLHSALWHARSLWVAIVACDLPFVSERLIARLAALREADGDAEEYEAVVPVQPDGRRQPLCALYRRVPALRRATESLDCGEYELNSFIARLRTREVTPDEFADLPGAPRFFVNINTPEEYEVLSAES